MLSANNRLAVYDLRTEQLKFLKIPYDDIRLNSIQNLGKDTIGLGAENGIILFDVRKKNFKYVAVHFAAENSNVQNIFNVSSTNSKEFKLCVNSSFNIDTRLFRKTAIRSQCSKHVDNEIIETSMP